MHKSNALLYDKGKLLFVDQLFLIFSLKVLVEGKKKWKRNGWINPLSDLTNFWSIKKEKEKAFQTTQTFGHNIETVLITKRFYILVVSFLLVYFAS